MQEHLYDGHGCLLRWIDDYLYLSTRREKVESFLTRLNRGFSAYGCFITPSKTVVNFDTSQGTNDSLFLLALSFFFFFFHSGLNGFSSLPFLFIIFLSQEMKRALFFVRMAQNSFLGAACCSTQPHSR